MAGPLVLIFHRPARPDDPPLLRLLFPHRRGRTVLVEEEVGGAPTVFRPSS